MWQRGLRFHPTLAEVLFSGLLEDAESTEAARGDSGAARAMAGLAAALTGRRRGR